MDIENLGEKLIDKLVDLKMVRSLADLYRLDEPTLAEMERMGKKSAANLVAAIAASKTRTLDRLLTGLTIRHVGTRVSEILAERLGTLDAIRSASLETLGNVPEIGPVVAASVFHFFHDEANSRAIDDLIAVGVDPLPLDPGGSKFGLTPARGQDVRDHRDVAEAGPRRNRGLDQEAWREGERVGLEIDEFCRCGRGSRE